MQLNETKLYLVFLKEQWLTKHNTSTEQWTQFVHLSACSARQTQSTNSSDCLFKSALKFQSAIIILWDQNVNVFV